MRLFLLLLAVTFAGAAAAQQNYPTRPMRIVIPWPPGQATDLMGRITAQQLSAQLGQQIVPDNRPGAGGMIGTDVAAKSTPDGYTLLAASSGPVSINPLLQKAPYDPPRDLAPVANVVLSKYLLVTHPKVPVKNVTELIAYAKANPGKLRFATSGAGATAHLITEYFNGRAGIQALHVPYKGSAPAMIDLIGGQVEYAVETVAATWPHVKAGRLRAHGVTASKPSPLAPGIEPLATAANMPGFDMAAWIGIMVPAKTPKAIIDRLAAGIEKAIASSEMQTQLSTAGLEPEYIGPADFANYLKATRERYLDVIKKNNIRIEGST